MQLRCTETSQPMSAAAGRCFIVSCKSASTHRLGLNCIHSASYLPDGKLVTDCGRGFGNHPGGQLQHAPCPPMQSGHSERRHCMPHVDNSPCPIQENHVNRETHGHGVYGLRWQDQQASARLKAGFAEQTNHALPACSGHTDAFAQHGFPGSVEDCDSLHSPIAVSGSSSHDCRKWFSYAGQ